MPRFNIEDDLIYVECGDKLNYAACYLPEQDGDLVFLGWIRKFCFKYGIQMKVSKEDLGLTHAGWKKKKAQEEMAIEEVEKDETKFIYNQNIKWNYEEAAII
jgi:hypothetical protein